MDQKLVVSEDGSHTVFSKNFDAHYHSIYGALDESVHVFIQSGLFYQLQRGLKSISIFEMGFGTGLNAYLTYLETLRQQAKISYTGIEYYPVDLQLISELNFNGLVQPNHPEIFQSMHSSSWNAFHQFGEMTFKKIKADIKTFDFESTYDVIYYDAFAPTCQGFLWEQEIQEKFYNALNPGGILVTYCAKGSFKRVLKSLGYQLQSLKGPGKKREMIRAVKRL